MNIEQDSDEYINILQETKETLFCGDCIEDLKYELFKRETNFNNADITSHQCCFTTTEISDAVDMAVEQIGSDFKNTDDIIF